jgi:two-component system cell cycle sensor histidine kinase/response regulator CckA
LIRLRDILGGRRGPGGGRGQDELAALLAALPEPAAICEVDGGVVLANPAWVQAVGSRRGLAGQAWFKAFRAALSAGRAEAALPVGDAAPSAAIACLGPERFLVRLLPSLAPEGEGNRVWASRTVIPAGALKERVEPGPSSLAARVVGLGPGSALRAVRDDVPDMRLASPLGEGDPEGVEGAAPPRGETALSRTLADPAPFGAALVEGSDPFSGAIVEANAALWTIVGCAAFAGATLADLVAEASRSEIVAHMADGEKGPFEVSLTGAPGRAAQLYLVRTAGRTAAYLIDVTAQKDLQLQLAQRRKMEAIGQLAGGVAHDFNNLLTAIGMRIDELLLRHPVGDPAYESLGEVRESVNRAAALVLQLLTFSRKATVRREVVDLGAALVDFEVLLRRLLRENMRLETHHGPGAPLVRIDKGQLEMAVMNLVVNARDALRQGGGGTIRLRTARLSAAEAEALGCPARPAGDVALIEVADDGPGIAPQVLGSIFEPFFTTKAAGEGTGLGLATVYGIVKQADGWIVAASPPGEGAVFRVFLPAHVPRLSLDPAAAAPPRRRPRDLSGAGRILFVEDEDRVRDIAARLLRGRGYEVIEARDGEEALELARANAGRIDLMISDVSMPGMDGPALLKAARPYLAAAPVMFISGYAESDFSDLLEGETGISFLPKPLRLQSLAEQVKERLQAG